jgi:hypothetical protein
MSYSFFSRAVSVCSLVALAACGGGGSKDNDMAAEHPADMSGNNISPDLSGKPGADLAGVDFAGVSCGTMSCGAGHVCCNQYNGTSMTLEQMCMTGSTCGDGGIAASCDGPEDCSGSTCCISVDVDNGNASGDAMCQATCAANVAQANGDTMVTTKLCHAASDCTGLSGNTPVGPLAYSSCCQYPGVTYKICAPGLITVLNSAITCTN